MRNYTKNSFSIHVLIGFSTIFCGCENFVDVDLSKSKITSQQVFHSDVTATSAVTGIYQRMLDPGGFASGSHESLMGLAGLSADEFSNYSQSPVFIGFEMNQLDPENQNVLKLWSSLYKTIYESNAVIEGLSDGQDITISTKDQLHGEALFIRAFCHFYLVNLFGDVPLVTKTDYRLNARLSRTPVTLVYEQIKNDLNEAIALLGDDYVTPERVRPNKSTALALSAKVALYTNDWKDAEETATKIIENPIYALEQDLDQVFLANSTGAIWQLMPVFQGYNTNEARYFVIGGTTPLYHILRKDFVNAFEPGDNRLQHWVMEKVTDDETFLHPYKYKVSEFGQPLTEYSIVFRLAEQYLIRAEARAMQNNLNGALADVDVIRHRASLPLLQDTDPGINQELLLQKIEQERMAELFSEWGNRWLDLKRTARTEAVLAPIKTHWSPSAELYPLPASELRKNTNLKNQNPGYE